MVGQEKPVEEAGKSKIGIRTDKYDISTPEGFKNTVAFFKDAKTPKEPSLPPRGSHVE
jgi:hypothetical protein